MNSRPPRSSLVKRYSLQLTGDIARQLQRCRASIRQAIELKLQEILAAAPGHASPSPRPQVGGPPLRFYVFEGFRVSYEIRPASRTVAVLDIRKAPG
jgi:hypothetical protein